MTYSSKMVFVYTVVIMGCAVVTALLCYLFGWFFDKRLRIAFRRVKVPRRASFYLRFRSFRSEAAIRIRASALRLNTLRI